MNASKKTEKLTISKKIERRNSKVSNLLRRLPELNATQFSALCGITVETVSNWADAGMPCERTRQGKAMIIRLTDALPWVISLRDAPPGSERERLVREQADAMALRNAVTRGELLIASDVAAQDMTLAADFAGRLEGIPGRLAGELAAITDPAEVRQRLQSEMRALRSGFADAIRKVAETEPR